MVNFMGLLKVFGLMFPSNLQVFLKCFGFKVQGSKVLILLLQFVYIRVLAHYLQGSSHVFMEVLLLFFV
jgi:hypothetical protein